MNLPSQKNWNWFLKQLKTWYHPDKRKLPWKDIDDAYLVWVSEVFLQQTQADRVVEFFIRFTSRFPTVERLAEASFEEALPYFRGLGFYGRLRRMLETARAVVEMQKIKEEDEDLWKNAKSEMRNKKQRSKSNNQKQHSKAKFPSDIEELEKLPGIGPYTARAVASFAYGQKVLAPDTNVKRILTRFFGTSPKAHEAPKALKTPNPDKWVMKNLEWFDEQYPEDFSLNQVLMDFGASVCGAAKPKCGECPLKDRCAFSKNSKFESRNAKQISNAKMQNRKQRSLRGYRKVVVGILIQDKKVLVSRRRPDQTYAGLLEFPGGKVELGEDERRALQREYLEEIGVEISVRPAFEKIVQHGKKQVLSFHRCRILSGEMKMKESFGYAQDKKDEELRGLEGQEVMWIHQDDLEAKEFLPANKHIIEQLKTSRL